MRSGWLALAASRRGGVPFIVKIHTKVWLEVRQSIHMLPWSVRLVVTSFTSEVGFLPVVVLELVLIVINWAMVMVDDGPVVELRELFDVVRVVVGNIRCSLNHMVMVGDHLDVVPVVKLVVELRVVARVLPVEVNAVQGQVLVDVVAVRGDLIWVPLVVVLIRGRHVSMLVGHPVLEWQIVEVLILMLDRSVVGGLVGWRRVGALNDCCGMVGRGWVDHDAVLLLLGVVHGLVRQWVLVVDVLVVVDRVVAVHCLVLANRLFMIDSLVVVGRCLMVNSLMMVGRLLTVDSLMAVDRL